MLIELNVNETLTEMRKMFDYRQSRLKLRKQFKEWKWKAEEAFSIYYHDYHEYHSC